MTDTLLRGRLQVQILPGSPNMPREHRLFWTKAVAAIPLETGRSVNPPRIRRLEQQIANRTDVSWPAFSQMLSELPGPAAESG